MISSERNHRIMRSRGALEHYSGTRKVREERNEVTTFGILVMPPGVSEGTSFNGSARL